MIKVGDTIKCRDKDDMVNTLTDLAREGIETDFMYEKDGENGLWLVVTDVVKDVVKTFADGDGGEWSWTNVKKTDKGVIPS